MKKLLRTILFASATLLFLQNSTAQNRNVNNNTASTDPVFPCICANPANPVFNATDVSFLNKDSAVAVGSGGMAWMSIDGGLNWSVISTFTSTANNNSVYWEDNYICIVGDSGNVTFSGDKGLTWQKAATAQPTINYRAVDFADTTFGVSVGDAGDAVVYKWVGILDWAHIPTGLHPKLNAVSAFKTSISIFTDGNAIAVGDSGVVATYALGNWIILPHSLTTDLNGIYLFDDHVTVLAVGDSGLIMRSPDFGITWNILHYGTSESLNDISEGAGPNEIIAVGDSGVIYFSTDDGYTFTRYTVGINTTNLKGVSSKNPRGSFGGSGSTLRTFTSDTVRITSVSKTIFCPGDNFKTAINLKGLYGNNNLVSLELSDSSGSFSVPVVIGTKSNPMADDSITGTIPANAKPSLLYKVRISSSSPMVISNPHFNNLTFNANVGNVSLQLSSTNLYVYTQVGCTYQWYYNSAPISGATDTIVSTIGNGTYYLAITNSNGCSISSNVFNYLATVVGASTVNSQIVISPNPANNSLFVKVPDTSGNRTMQLYNALGRKVYSANVKPGQNNFSISDLEPGMYFITLDTYTGKIIVTR